ncbi:MAG: hypothetical protein VB065_14110 [Eubacteriales bacterium]|nr:hypothetical protein [Christensenellaceae bacterium]MEA5067170.1 hypothetical protein [Eubacteriales bacterium]
MSDPIIIPVAPQALSVRILSDEQAMSAGINPAIFRGKNAYLHIRYAPNGSPMDDEIGTIPNEYIGLCTNDNPEAPTTADSYVWIHISHQNAEDARVAAEQARATAEQDRIAVESARVAAESDRASAEQGRVTAEAARETAEAAREAAPKYLHIRYAEVENPGDGQILTTPNDYIGTAVTANSVAPTSASAYQWARFRGHDGTGTGDMHTSIYDPTQSGVVLRAAQADALAAGASIGTDQVTGLDMALAGKATKPIYFDATIPSGTTGDYTMTGLTGMLETDRPDYGLRGAITATIEDDWAKVKRMQAGADQAVFTISEALTGALDIQIRVVR